MSYPQTQSLEAIAEHVGTTEAEILRRCEDNGWPAMYGIASRQHWMYDPGHVHALVESYAGWDRAARFLTDESCRKVAVHVVENNGKWATDSDNWDEILADCLEFIGCGESEATLADRALIESLVGGAVVTITLPEVAPEN